MMDLHLPSFGTLVLGVPCYVFYATMRHVYSRFDIWHTAHKMKFSIKDFFSKCDQIRRKLQIWSYLLTKSLMENFIFCAMTWLLQAL